jgi:hypothetical protein
LARNFTVLVTPFERCKEDDSESGDLSAETGSDSRDVLDRGIKSSLTDMASEGFRRSGAGPSPRSNDSTSTLTMHSSTGDGFNATIAAVEYNAFNERIDGAAARRRAELEGEMKAARAKKEEKVAQRQAEKAEKKARKQARKQAKIDEKARKQAEKDEHTLAEAPAPAGRQQPSLEQPVRGAAIETGGEVNDEGADEVENRPSSPASFV